MADINKVRNPLEVKALDSFAVTTSYKYLPVDFQDERTAFVVNSTNAGTLTIAAGDGYAAVTDEVLEIPAGFSAFYIDSNRFKVSAGENKGKIKIKGSAAMTLYVVAVGVAADQTTPELV